MRRNLFHATALASFLALALSLNACAVWRGGDSGTALEAPEISVMLMRDAVRGGDLDAFMHTLSGETLARYETVVLHGWPQVREHFAFLADSVEIVDVTDIEPMHADADASRDFVFPERGKPARRLRARVRYEGATYVESFLFVRETDPPRANTKASPVVRVGEYWYGVSEHPLPQRYQTAGAGELARTHWRLVFPYFPYQGESELTQRAVERMREIEKEHK